MPAAPASTKFRPRADPDVMKRRRMLLAVIAGTPLLLVLLAITLPPLLIDSAPFRARVIELANMHTGRELRIDGELRLRLFPHALITAADVRLANPPGLEGAAFAELAELEMELNLMPLLAGRIEMRRLVARGLTLNLARGEGGHGNWDGLVRAEAGADSARASEDGTRTAVGAMALRDATVTWRDPATGAVTPIAEIDVEFAALHPGVRIEDLRVRATLAGGASAYGAAVIDAHGDVEFGDGGAGFLMPSVDATITGLTLAGARIDAALETRLAGDLSRQHLTFDGLHVSAQAVAGEGARATLVLDAALDFDLAGQRLAPGEVTLEVPAYAVSGFGGALQLGGVLAGDLQAGDYALTAVQSQGSIGKDGSERVPFRFGADLALSAGSRVLTAKNLRLSLDERRASGALEVRAVETPPGTAGLFELLVDGQALSGNFAVSETGAGHDLRLELLADLDAGGGRYGLRGRNALTLSAGIQRGPQARGYRISDLLIDADLAHAADSTSAERRLAVTLRADVDLENESLRSNNLRLALNESRITGSVELRGFAAPAVHFDLQADTIDADRLMPPPVSTETETRTTPVRAVIEAIRALDLNGEMRVEKMTLRGLELENVRIRSGEGVTDG